VKLKKRFLTLAFLLVVAAFLLLVLRVGYPHHRALALTLYAGSLVSFARSLRGKRDLFRRHRGWLRGLLPYALVLILLVGFAYALRVVAPMQPSALTEWSEEDFDKEIRADEQLVRYLVGTMDTALTRDTLVENWADCYRVFFELDLIKQRYQGFYMLDIGERPDAHVASFLMTYSAFLAQMSLATQVAAVGLDDADVRTRLNEAQVDLGIPPDTLFHIEQSLTHPDNQVRLHTGRAYLEVLRGYHGDYPDVVAWIESTYTTIVRNQPPELLLKNPLNWLEKKAFAAWFPVQKQIALEMSHVRVKDRDYFIQPDQIANLADRLQPGDILIERRNWHMTNIGIPGFWPHMALYIGRPNDVAEQFSGLLSITGFKERFQSHLDAWRSTSDEEGNPATILEALRPGVILNSLETSAHCDHLAVLRPRVSDAEKLQAIECALTMLGRPYDYNFDFSTDNELVCSELVFKAYQHAESLKFPIEEVSGRKMLPPNRLVEEYDKTVGTDACQFDLVGFLDGNETSGYADVKDQAEFRESWSRPKWYVWTENKGHSPARP